MQKTPSWLIFVEGTTDKETYMRLFMQFSVSGRGEFKIVPSSGKENMLIQKTLHDEDFLIKEIEIFLTYETAKGIIFIIDTDEEEEEPFKNYIRHSKFEDEDVNRPPSKLDKYWHIDMYEAKKDDICVYGINVPYNREGCLETELLKAYNFPSSGGEPYGVLEKIIKEVSIKNNLKRWYDKNEKSRMDKFIFTAFFEGFKCIRENIEVSEPEVIKIIKQIIKH